MFHVYFTQSLPSITDWIQAIAGIAVLATFFLQYRLNKLQATQLRVTTLPIITLTYEPEEAFFDPETRNAGIINITLKKNVVYDLTCFCKDREDFVFDLNGSVSMMENDTHVKRFSYNKGELPYFILELNYKDIAGNKYSQDFRYWNDRFLPNAPIFKN